MAIFSLRNFSLLTAVLGLLSGSLSAQPATKPAGALVITVSGTPLTIPQPAGFALVTPALPKAYELQAHFIGENNVQYAFYLPAETVASLAPDSVPVDMHKAFRLQSAKSMEGKTVPMEDFSALKGYLKKNITEMLQRATGTSNSQIERTNEELVEMLKFDPALSLVQAYPVKGFSETENALSTSLFMKVNRTDKQGKTITCVEPATTTLLYVKGRLLFLYCYGHEQELEWTRESSKAWAAAILAANKEKSLTPVRPPSRR